MSKSILLLCFLASVASCTPMRVSPPESVDELLSGVALFGEEVGVSDISESEVLALDDDMREFVRAKAGGLPTAKSRLRRLLKGMITDGLLSLDYDPNLTYTAKQTFHSRQGNCLSFSNLFVAMAREANLEVSFQMVDIPPSYNSEGDFVLLNNHINILVSGIRSDTTFMQDFVVDFNTAEYNGNYDTKKMSDTYALALYFSNRSVESMQQNDIRSAFRFLKKGIQLDPEIAGLWVNLGVLYSRNQHDEFAVQSYQQALSIQSSNKSALVNLVAVLGRLDRPSEADYYLSQVTYYRDHNPYYHYSLGQAAFNRREFNMALVNLDDAIRLKKDEHQFYYLQGLVYLAIEDIAKADRSFVNAKKHAEREQLISA